MFELLTGDIPYDSLINERWKFRQNIEEDAKKGIKPPYSLKKIESHLGTKAVPKEMVQLLESCWEMKPWNRPLFSSVFSL